MILNLDFNIVGLDGRQIMIQSDGGIKKAPTAAELVASEMAKSNTGDPIKMMSIALKLYDVKRVEVDKSDLGLVRDFVSKSTSFTNLAKYQILEAMDKIKAGTEPGSGPDENPPEKN